MTQDPQIILKGLECCSHINCLCEECPFCQTEVHCRELESDAEQLIKSLLNQVSYYKGLYEQRLKELGIDDE